MIRLDVEQGSRAWLMARLGIPTASNFSKILTPKTWKLSESSGDYRNLLLAEWLLGEPIEDGTWGFTERGTVMEDGARRFYEFERNVAIDRVGFLLRDDRRAGGSPDGLVGTDGMVEIKVPSAHVHVGYLLESTSLHYQAQIQGNLWIAEREWCDFLSYHPTLPPLIARHPRNDVYIKALSSAVEQFCDRLFQARELLKMRGYEPAPAPELDAVFSGVG